MTYITPEQARDFYSRVGRWQDTQAFYERSAVAAMLAHGAFGDAHSVAELGCGTGKLAAELMGRLPSDARYVGIDVSPEMVRLATERLRRWNDRAEARVSDGDLRLPVADGACDRVVSTYVLDLLSPADARAATAEAARALAPGGLLCLVSLAAGAGGVAGLVSRAWLWTWARRPGLVGGCRPIRLEDTIDAGAWDVVHHEVVAPFAVASEVLIARRLPATMPSAEDVGG